MDYCASRNTYKMVKMQTELVVSVHPCHVETEITVPAKLSVCILQLSLIKHDLLMFTDSLWATRTFEFL